MIISFPLLTNHHQVGLKNMEGVDKTPMSVEKVNLFKLYQDQESNLNAPCYILQAINIIHDVFISAAEREIHTGDGISLKVIS